ncbi:MAG: alpha/beta fold hydrolase [Acidimicrobiales bacterium]
MLGDAEVRAAVEAASADGEFRLFASAWSGALILAVDDGPAWRILLSCGAPGPVTAAVAADGLASSELRVAAPAATWDTVLRSPPPPMYTDMVGPSLTGQARFDPGLPDAGALSALRRMIELLRHVRHKTDPAPQTAANLSRHGSHDQAVGRYVHLDLDGVDHRVYYEEAGAGIGLLCQHTAGADGRQWRHLLEDRRVTDRFRVIVYDLPYHGKSLPPESVAWWAREYRLTTASAMAVPVALAGVLGLDRPVFMGSSIGGHLALDLAAHHRDEFRAVIALEAALKMPRNEAVFPSGPDLSDPARHAAVMMTLMAPQAPERYRHETRLHYAQGAPGVFPGDTHYYFTDHDLRDQTWRFDTARCPVHLLTGEYDAATVGRTLEAADRIAGSTVEIMTGLGHFPMSEDYPRLMTYVLPILDDLASRRERVEHPTSAAGTGRAITRR